MDEFLTSLNEFDIRQVILCHPPRVSPEMPLSEIVAAMTQANADPAQASIAPGDRAPLTHPCVLVMEGGTLRGLITPQDLILYCASDTPLAELTAAEVMQPAIILPCPQLNNLFKVLNLFRDGSHHCLAIADENQQILGVLTPQSILNALSPSLEDQNLEQSSSLPFNLVKLQREIQHHRLTEALLRASQSRFEKLSTNVPGVIYQFLLRTDGSNCFPYISSGIRELCGLEPEQVTQNGQLLWQMVHPDDVEMLQTTTLASAEMMQPWHAEFRLITPSGQVKWIEGMTRPEQLETGDILWDGFLLDISDRKQAEQELNHNRDLREAIFNESTDAIFLVDIDTLLTLECNERAVELFEADSKEELIGISGNTLQRHQFTQAELEAIAQEVEERGFWSREIEYVSKKGSCFWANLSTKNLTVAGKRMNLVRLTDISDRKQDEVLRQQQMERELLIAGMTQRIRQSLKLQDILDTSVAEIQDLLKADRVLVYRLFPDNTGKAVAETVVPAFRRVLDVTFPAEAFPPECYQRYVNGGVYNISDRDRATIVPCMVDFMAQFQIRAKLVVPIVQKQRLWGLLIAHQCSAPRQWQPWEITLLQQLADQLAIATHQSELYQQLQTELGERRQAEVKLQNINDQLALINAELARATRLKDEFLANMSHELRTPLNAILGMAEGLQEEVFGSLSDRQRKAIQTVEKSGRHLLELINDILDLAKIEAGKVELHRTQISLKTLCTASLTFVKQMAMKKHLNLQAEIPDHPATLTVDERRVRQILVNLLSNAVKFTPEGGTVQLQVRSGTTALLATGFPPLGDRYLPSPLPQSPISYVYFSIEDSGIGIRKSDLHSLFQSFVQIDSSLDRHYAGTGLGLSLVRRIAELHQGFVMAESAPGKGSRFTVAIPLQPLMPVTELSSHQKLLILLDDHTHLEETAPHLISQLSELNINVAVYPQNDLVFQGILSLKPDAIALDLPAATSEGWAFLSTLQAELKQRNLPIIAITQPELRDRAFDLGISACLTHPINPAELQQVLTYRRVGSSSRFSSPPAVELSPLQSPVDAPLILIAEDNQMNIDPLTSYLRKRGFQLAIATNGQKAIDMARAEQPHLILMDIQMPEMDGLEAIRRIRADPELAQIPIIALTALAMAGDRERCLAAGANDYVSKPFSLRQLVNLIHQWLNQTSTGLTH